MSMDTRLHQRGLPHCRTGRGQSLMRPTDDTGGFLIRQLIWAADRDSDLLRPFFQAVWERSKEQANPGWRLLARSVQADRRRG